MSIDKKKQFVEKTFEILEKEGPEGVKIRRIAADMKCTSTVIYRYFEDLDYLVALASIRYFNEYIEDFKNMVSDPQLYTDPYGLNLKMWESLAGHAFKHIPLYESLFFGKYKDSLGEVIFEYYQMFMDDSGKNFDGYSCSILFNDDIYQRDLVLLRRAATLGIITADDAESLSQIECHIFHGILLKYMPVHMEEDTPEKAKEEFMFLLKELYRKYK